VIWTAPATCPNSTACASAMGGGGKEGGGARIKQRKPRLNLKTGLQETQVHSPLTLASARELREISRQPAQRHIRLRPATPCGAMRPAGFLTWCSGAGMRTTGSGARELLLRRKPAGTGRRRTVLGAKKSWCTRTRRFKHVRWENEGPRVSTRPQVPTRRRLTCEPHSAKTKYRRPACRTTGQNDA